MLPQFKPAKKTIYLDHAATTPVDPRVIKAMALFWSDQFGNPSSLYKNGQRGSQAINQAREQIAEIVK